MEKKINIDDVKKFATLFKGLDDDYGNIKGTWTHKPLTLDVYKRHLQGKESIGVGPLMRDGTVCFVAIDIDDEDQILAAENAAKVKEELSELGITAYIETSKSKGYHIYVFFEKPVKASSARHLMRCIWQKAVGGKIPEIFPKQNSLDKTSKGCGNYINLPYFGNSPKGKRVIVNGGHELTLTEFLDTALKNRVTVEQFNAALEKLPPELAPETTIKKRIKKPVRDIPLCAKKFMQTGAGLGSRRNSIFRLAAICNAVGYPIEVAKSLAKDVDQKNKPPIIKEFGEEELFKHVEGAYTGKDGRGYTSYGCDEDDWVSSFCPGREKCPVFNETLRVTEQTKAIQKYSYSAEELMRMEFPEIKWIIPEILTEGLTILGGKPKMGKSWLALNIAVAISSGTKALGKYPVEKNGVLYLALEDTGRRLKDRLTSVLQGEPVPNGLYFATRWPRLDEGGLQELEEWLDKHPGTRLVIIDTFQIVRQKQVYNNQYFDDYYAAGKIKEFADTHGIGILLIHHLKKMPENDPLDEFSGSSGVTAAADTLWKLTKDRAKTDAVLGIYSRDIEQQELALVFDKNITAWNVAGTAEEYRQSQERQEIIELFKNGGLLKIKEVAERLNKKESTIRWWLSKLVKDGVLVTPNRGLYTLSHKYVEPEEDIYAPF